MALKIDAGCYYAKTHEWVRIEGSEGVAGITDFAQQQLSDIVYVELPAAGDAYVQGQVFGVIESVKAASDCYLPIGGEILATNEQLQGKPELVNEDPYGAGWLVRFRVSDPAEVQTLMDAESYLPYAEKALAEGGH